MFIGDRRLAGRRWVGDVRGLPGCGDIEKEEEET
jgi:hypothetical protein